MVRCVSKDKLLGAPTPMVCACLFLGARLYAISCLWCRAPPGQIYFAKRTWTANTPTHPRVNMIGDVVRQVGDGA